MSSSLRPRSHTEPPTLAELAEALRIAAAAARIASDQAEDAVRAAEQHVIKLQALALQSRTDYNWMEVLAAGAHNAQYAAERADEEANQ
jgi:hypothetical protein